MKIYVWNSKCPLLCSPRTQDRPRVPQNANAKPPSMLNARFGYQKCGLEPSGAGLEPSGAGLANHRRWSGDFRRWSVIHRRWSGAHQNCFRTRNRCCPPIVFETTGIVFEVTRMVFEFTEMVSSPQASTSNSKNCSGTHNLVFVPTSLFSIPQLFENILYGPRLTLPTLCCVHCVCEIGGRMQGWESECFIATEPHSRRLPPLRGADRILCDHVALRLCGETATRIAESPRQSKTENKNLRD